MADWITVSSASRKLDVSDRTIRNWIDKGKLVAKKEKGVWLIDESSIRKVGSEVSDEVGKSEATMNVPIEHYDGLTIRLGQLEAENSQYRMMLQAHDDEQEARESEIARLKSELEYYRQPFYKRWLKKRKKDQG